MLQQCTVDPAAGFAGRVVTFDTRSGIVDITRIADRRRECFALVRNWQIVAIEVEEGADSARLHSVLGLVIAAENDRARYIR